MKRFVACFAFALSCLWTAGAGEAFAVQKRAPSSGAAEGYAVIRVGDEVKVIPKTTVGQEKKDAASKYKADLKVYQDAKKTAGKNPDQAADLKKPSKPVVTVLKASVKSQVEAEQFREKYLEDHKGLNAQKTASRNGTL